MKLFNQERFLFYPLGEGGGDGGGGGATSFEQIVADHSDGGDPGDENDGFTDDQDSGEGELEEFEDEDNEEDNEDETENKKDEEESELDKVLKMAKGKAAPKEDKQTLAVLNKALGKELQVGSMDELRDLVEAGKKGAELQLEFNEKKQQFAAEAKLVIKKLTEDKKEFEKERDSMKAVKREHWIADQAYKMLQQYDPEAYESFTRVLQHVSPYYKDDQGKKEGALTKEDIRRAMKEEKEEEQLRQATKEWKAGWSALGPKLKELKRLGIIVSPKLVQQEWIKDENISVEKALLKAYAVELNQLNKKRLQNSEKKNVLAMRDANLVGKKLGGSSKSSGRRMLDYDTFLSKF